MRRDWVSKARLGRPFLLVVAIAAFAPATAQGQAVIDNGTIQLGIHPEGHLNVPGPPSAQGTAEVGVRFLPTNNEATAGGCDCEGWGAADAISGTTGFANQSSDGGVNNMVPISFVSDADSAVSVVEIGAVGSTVLRVTHDYHPSPDTANLYEVTVTIENISAAAVDARYRRVMDWDVEPTAFDEFVTARIGDAAQLLDNDNDGFQTANPLGPDGDPTNVEEIFTGNFTDEGPDDHGARFDFGFGTLDPGESETFNIYYGGASNETRAEAAIAAVSGEVFSLGQPSTPDGPTLGTPNTFVFAFQGVGGGPVIPPYDEYVEGCPYEIDGETIQGGAGRNRISGSERNDALLGGGGNDKLEGLGGNDCIDGEAGIDRILGDPGKDFLRGSGGKDKINGVGRADRIFGEGGPDRLRGNGGKDKVKGGKGPDRLKGGTGRDVLNCGKGRDVAVAEEKDKVRKNCEKVKIT